MAKHDLVSEKSLVITYSYDTKLFTMTDLKGEVIGTGKSARALSKKAFAEGAFSVRHDYDLRLDDN